MSREYFDGQPLTLCYDDQVLDGFRMLIDDELVTYYEMDELEDKNNQGKCPFIPGSIAPQPYRTQEAITNSIKNTLVFRNGQIELKYKENIKYG